MTSRENQEAAYRGLLGLDSLPLLLRGLNFLLTVIVGGVLAFQSWRPELYRNPAVYDFYPFTWPVLFLLAWPLYAVPLWLRLTGLKWRWGFLAAGLALLLYFTLSSIADAIAWMMS